MRYLLGLGIFFGFCAAVAAQGAGGPYLGGGLGMTRYDGTGERGGTLSSDTNSFRALGGYSFGDRYAVEASWGIMPEIGETFEIFAVHGIAALPLSRISVYGGAGYYEASFSNGLPLESGDFEIPGIGTPDLTGVGNHDRRNDSGVTVIGGVLLNMSRISLRAEYEWLDTDGSFTASSINVLLLFRF